MTEYIVTDLDFHGRPIRAAALFEDRTLTELRAEAVSDRSIAGYIFRGYIKNISRNIDGAYIDIGRSTPVFLPMRGRKDLHPSMPVTVQIRKDAAGSKEPVASTCLQLAGRYLVTSDGSAGRSFSSLLTAEEKERLKEMVPEELCGRFHVTVRTNARHAGRGELLRELSEQTRTLEQIADRASGASKGTVLWKPPAFYEEMLRDLRTAPDRVTTDIPVCADALGKLIEEEGMPSVLSPGPDGRFSLAEAFGLSGELEKLGYRKVWLPCGGFLVIEKTEAFHAIDVNSGHCRKRGRPEDVYYMINREAAAEAARQIRLRNLSGMILIDFINMGDPSRRDELLSFMREELGKDYARPEAPDVTALGIMEIIRQKVRKPLAEVLNV